MRKRVTSTPPEPPITPEPRDQDANVGVWDPFWNELPANPVEPSSRFDAAALNTYEQHLAPADAQRRLRERGTEALRELALIHAFGAMTVPQFADATGQAIPTLPGGKQRRLSDLPHRVRDLYAAGMIEVGQLPGGGPIVMTPARCAATRAFTRSLAGNDRDYLLSGGQRWVRATNGLRHNLLTTELCLRLQRAWPEAVVHPQKLAGHDRITGNPRWQARSGDAVIYTPCGRRIIIETTCSGDYAAQRAKVTGCLDLLWETDDTIVWFVEAAEHNTTLSRVWNPLCTAIADIAQEHPRYAGRIAVSRWRWSWPGPGQEDSWSLDDGVAYSPGGTEKPWQYEMLRFPDTAEPWGGDIGQRLHDARSVAPLPHYARLPASQ